MYFDLCFKKSCFYGKVVLLGYENKDFFKNLLLIWRWDSLKCEGGNDWGIILIGGRWYKSRFLKEKVKIIDYSKCVV